MANVKSAMRGVPVTLLAAGSTNQTSAAIAIPNSFRNHKFTIIGSAGIGAGKVTAESANDPAYSGTWAAMAAETAAVASAEVEINVTGLFSFVRARASTTVTGGTIQVDYIGS